MRPRQRLKRTKSTEIALRIAKHNQRLPGGNRIINLTEELGRIRSYTPATCFWKRQEAEKQNRFFVGPGSKYYAAAAAAAVAAAARCIHTTTQAKSAHTQTLHSHSRTRASNHSHHVRK